MANTVTINIQNNCCCGGGAGSGGGSVTPGGGDTIIDVPWEQIPPPDGVDGPLLGYGPAAVVDDRQCKVAIFNYWWVYYMTDKLANTTEGALFVSLASNDVIPSGVKQTLALILLPVIGFVFGSLATPGIEISDILSGSLGSIIVTALLLPLVYFISTRNVTVPLLQDALTTLPQVKDRYICALSKTSDPGLTKKAIENVLSDPEYNLSTTQQEWLSWIASTMAQLLYYSADWWPSFDDETLSSITANCCGSFIDGQAQLPSGTEGCQTAWYIIDKLVAALNGIQNYWNWDWQTNGINWTSDADEETERVAQNLNSTYIPFKLLDKASNLPAFYRAIGQYINAQTYGFASLGSIFDYNWSNLADHLSANGQSVHTAMQAALDIGDAYEAVYNPLEAWLDTNVTDTDLNTYMKNAINGLIQPTGSTGDYLNMLFYQDADLATYAATNCGGGSNDPATYSPSAQCGIDTATATYDFAVQQYNWSHSAVNGSSVYTGALFRATGTALYDTTLILTQQVKHSVQSVRVTFNVPTTSNATRCIIFTADDLSGPWTQLGMNDWPPEPTTIFTNLCINNKYIRIRIDEYVTDTIEVSKIEFLQ